MSPLAITSHVRSTLEQSTSTPEQASAGGAAQRSDAAKLVCSCFPRSDDTRLDRQLSRSVEVEEERGIRRRPYRHTLLNSLLHRHQAC